jgi:ParB family chromosome partitioning protein
MVAVGDDLQWPRAVPRNLGIEAARVLKESGGLDDLRLRLRAASTADAQNEVLKSFTAGQGAPAAKPARAPKEKFEFHLGQTKVTARKGECRIVSGADYTAVPKARLEEAIKAFEAVLNSKGNPRVTRL